MQRPSEHGLTAEEAVAQAQAEGLVLARSEEGEGNSGFAGVEHVPRAVELQDCPYKATHETTYLGYFGSAEAPCCSSSGLGFVLSKVTREI